PHWPTPRSLSRSGTWPRSGPARNSARTDRLGNGPILRPVWSVMPGGVQTRALASHTPERGERMAITSSYPRKDRFWRRMGSASVPVTLATYLALTAAVPATAAGSRPALAAVSAGVLNAL